MSPKMLPIMLAALTISALAAAAAAAAAAASLPGSAVVSEVLGRVADAGQMPPGPPRASHAERLLRPDPYDEFAEPRQLDWPDGRHRRRLTAEQIRRRLLWRLSRHPGLRAALEHRRPLPPHKRDSRLDRPDPYRELASEAYYRFVRAILDMRNRMVALHGFDDSSAVREFFDEKPPTDSGNSTTTPAPSTEPELTPSPPVLVCPPRWRLGDRKCEQNGTFCFQDSECPDSRCCFDGCKLRCLEPELLVRHVCTDYTNSTVFPGDLYMRQREQICTCDELGRPQGCKDNKPCVDIISSSLFKLPFISDETVQLKKPERTTRQKIYDALQEAFKHVKHVY